MENRFRAVLIVAMVCSHAATVRAEDAAILIADVWARYRGVSTEREQIDIAVVASPQAAKFTRSDADALIRDGGTGVTRKRVLRQVRYATDGRDKLYVRFLLPPADAGTAFLVWRQPDSGQDQQLLYLPALRKVRRVPVGNTQTFVGTDLSYEDVRGLTGERLERFNYEFLPDEQIDGRACRVVAVHPKADTSSAYGSRKMWIDTERRFPLQVEFNDTRGALWKRMRNHDLNEVRPGAWRAALVEMRDVPLNETTLLLTTERSVGIEIPAEVFTEDYLAHPSE